MLVFNPGRVPATVDKGRLVPAGERADVPDGPRLRRLIAAKRLAAVEKPKQPPKENS